MRQYLTPVMLAIAVLVGVGILALVIDVALQGRWLAAVAAALLGGAALLIAWKVHRMSVQMSAVIRYLRSPSARRLASGSRPRARRDA